MKLVSCLILGVSAFASIYANANSPISEKTFQDFNNYANQIKAWECRDMENGGTRLKVIDETGHGTMDKVPSSNAAFRGTNRPTASLPPCRVDLIDPPSRRKPK